ncbi:MAG: xanthine dehydrogenase family protein subunit M [Elusimicrobiaceae bacterium]|nr:xanthine dehydrogenase family protein subunit M [Elusimicrobiaceae bacterium]
MPITHEFEFLRPSSLGDALSLLADRSGIKPLAGGTDLIVRLKNGQDTPSAVMDLKQLPELGGLAVKDGVLTIGAGVTFAELIESPLIRKHYPLLAEAAQTVASGGVRNRATLAGNIVSAVPSCDSATCLLVCDASVMAVSARGERAIPITEWFSGPRSTALQPDELVKCVRITLPEKKTGGCYVKLARYNGEDLAQAGVSVLVDSAKNYRVALSAVCPAPKRLRKTEIFLKGKRPTDKTLSEAVKLVALEVCAITDIRATVEYRAHMTGIMFKRCAAAAFARLEGKGPRYGEKLV